MRCSSCTAKAVYISRYSGQSFCAVHFIEQVEKKFSRALKRGRMLERGEKVAIAISGGKDSLTLAYMLKKLEGKLNLSLQGILIDEGIQGYRQKNLENAREFCRDIGLELEVKGFKGKYSLSLDEMAKMGGKSPCTYCGVFRRELLNAEALELNASKLATGHNLDDEVQAILMNYLKGDVERLVKMGSSTSHKLMVPRIKPLSEVPEKEVALYSLLNEFPVSLEECPHASSFRVRARDIINDLEESSPGIRYSILRGYQKIHPAIEASRSRAPLKRCRLCSQATSQEVCAGCRLKDELGI